MARRPSAGSILFTTSESPLPQTSSQSSTSRRPSTQLVAPRPPARTTSSSHKLDTHVNFSEIDPDELFSKHSIAEVKLVQQRLRTDADAKQEELRLMVGERYRDLLQASTSILELARSSKHVLELLEEMRDTVSAVNPVRAPKPATTGEDKHLQTLQSLSAHVKLLLDAPEHLWRLMERKAYLHAAWLFLLARVVHRALSQEEDDQGWQAHGIDVMEQMPLVQRQWDTITPFRSQISHRATLFLREANSSAGEVCATLLTLHLLESRPLPETLSIYLAQRTKTLSSMLTPNASTSANGEAKPNGKIPHRPRKVAVRETRQKTEAVLDAISRTVATARITFADNSDGSSLMRQALQFFQAPTENVTGLPTELQMSTQILLTSLPSSSHLQLLPLTIRTYKPYIDSATVTNHALQDQLRDKLEGWFRRAIQNAQGVLADWFASLDSIREVWEVRVSLLRWLQDATGLESPERLELKSVIDNLSRHQATSVWKGSMTSLEVSFQQAVTSAIDSLEHDAGQHPNDIQPVEHLFQAPSLPSLLQTSAQSSAVAAQFAKYKASLQLQLTGRTPLLEAALVRLEQHATNLHKDVSVIMRSDETESISEKMSTAYQTDAESAAEKICDILDNVSARETSSSRTPVFIARLCQELASSSDFFTRIGCSSAVVEEVFRERMTGLYVRLLEKWQEQTVSRIIDAHLAQHTRVGTPEHRLTGSITRPSQGLTQALLSLSSDMQQLGVCLEDDRRRQQAASTLRRFIVAYLARLEQSPATSSPVVAPMQELWDLAFLLQLDHLWGQDDTAAVSEQIEARLVRQRESLVDIEVTTQSDLVASAQEYLAKTQVLLAGLLPCHASPPRKSPTSTKTEKMSSLLLFGTPSVEQRFEPALELVKTPPRFGLLLVGGATVR